MASLSVAPKMTGMHTQFVITYTIGSSKPSQLPTIMDRCFSNKRLDYSACPTPHSHECASLRLIEKGTQPLITQ